MSFLAKSSRKQIRGMMSLRAERGSDQYGGPFTKTAPAVRRARRRRANKTARLARRANR